MTGHPDERAVRYLLEEMPPEERDLFEEEYAADKARLQELLAAEDDLIDRYCEEMLSPDQRLRFERRYLASVEDRERVAFARTLKRTLDQNSRPAVRPGRPAHTPLRWASWAALLAVALATAAWLARRPQGGAPRAEIESLQRQLVLQQERAREQDRRLKEAEQEAAQAREQAQALQDLLGLAAGTTPRSVSLLLAHRLRRDVTAVPRLVLEPGVDIVRLQVRLSGTPRPSYRASLQTAEGREVWARDRLNPATEGGVATLSFAVPAARLSAGQYVVALVDAATARRDDVEAAFAFEVRRAR